jgi:hypothetical protein
MGNVTKSQAQNILSPNGNSLAIYVDGVSGIITLKDVQGNTEPLSNYISEGNTSPFEYNSNASGIQPKLGSNDSSGANAFIGGGQNNDNSGANAFIGGGNFNSTSNSRSFIGNGYCNSNTGREAFIGNGEYHTASADYSFIGNGCNNINEGGYSSILNGVGNCVTDIHSFIGGGNGNYNLNSYSFIGNGCRNVNNNCFSTILNGLENEACADFSTIIGGKQAKTFRFGEVAKASGCATDIGDVQQIDLTAFANAPSGGNVVLTLDGDSILFNIPDGYIVLLTIKSLGFDDVNGKLASQLDYIVIKNIGGASIVYQVNIAKSNDVGYSVTLSLAGADLRITGISGSSNPIKWIAHLSGVQIKS